MPGSSDEGDRGRDGEYRDDDPLRSTSSGGKPPMGPIHFDPPPTSYVDPDVGDGIEEVILGEFGSDVVDPEPMVPIDSGVPPADHGDHADDIKPYFSTYRHRSDEGGEEYEPGYEPDSDPRRSGSGSSSKPGRRGDPPPVLLPPIGESRPGDETMLMGGEPGGPTGFQWQPWMFYTGAGVIIFLILLGVFLVFFRGDGDEPLAGGGTTLPPVTTTTVPDGTTTTLPGTTVTEPPATNTTLNGGTTTTTTGATTTTQDEPPATTTTLGPVPPDLIGALIADSIGNTVDCATGEPLDRPGADIVGVYAHLQGDMLVGRVDTAEDFLVNFDEDFSIAQLMELFGFNSATAEFEASQYLIETHAEVPRIGQLDSETGDVIPGTEEFVEADAGGVTFTVPVDPDNLPFIARFGGFNSPSEGDATGCNAVVVPVEPFPAPQSPTPGDCTPTQEVACLNNDRFRVDAGSGGGSLSWLETTSGYSAVATLPDGSVLPLWVLNGCAATENWWVFYAAATSVEFTITVVDTATGEVKTYFNPPGEPAPPIQDTRAFATCP